MASGVRCGILQSDFQTAGNLVPPCRVRPIHPVSDLLMQTTEPIADGRAVVTAVSPILKPKRRYVLAAASLLVGLVAAVYGPMLGFEFVDYDVTGQVVDNPHIRGLTWTNLQHILTTRCVTSYYPVRTLSFALDYQLWGLNPAGFELTNGLIHLANVLLVFWLALRLFAIGSAERSGTVGGWEVFLSAVAAGFSPFIRWSSSRLPGWPGGKNSS